MAYTTAQSTATLVQELYIAYFGRPADVAGANNATALINWNGNPASLLVDFGKSGEYTSQFTGLTPVQTVDKIYQNLFGRHAESAGLNFWATKIASGEITLANAVWTILDGVTAGSVDDTAVSSKVTWATAFTSALSSDANASVAYNASTVDSVKAQLLTVKDAATLATANTGLTAFVTTMTAASTNGGVVGSTFTLTDKIGESVIGTTGNDTFKAVLGATGAASDSTLNLGDSIDGGAGTDTLNLIMTGTNTAFPGGVTVKDVEIVNIDVTGAAAVANAATLKASNFTGVKELWQIDNAAAGGTFANVTVASGVVAGFASTGNKATAQVAIANADFGGTATAGTIALNGVADTSAVTFVGAKLETVTVNGSVTQNAATTANTLTVVTAGQETALNLGLTSNTTVTVTDTSTTLKSVDTSSGTGNITADLIALTKLVSFKGGAAAENITLDVEGKVSAKATTVDLGAGNDTLTLNGAAATANIEGTKITLGAGKDTLVTKALGNIFDATEANFAKGIIEVTDFAKADDVLNMNNNGLALTTAQLDTIKGAASLFAAVTAAGALTNGAGKTTVAFTYGSDAYVLVDGDNNGFDSGDGLIKLTGVSAYDLTNVQNGNLVL